MLHLGIAARAEARFASQHGRRRCDGLNVHNPGHPPYHRYHVLELLGLRGPKEQYVQSCTGPMLEVLLPPHTHEGQVFAVSKSHSGTWGCTGLTPNRPVMPRIAHALRVQVPKHEVYAQTIVSIPTTDTLNTLYIGSLDP